MKEIVHGSWSVAKRIERHEKALSIVKETRHPFDRLRAGRN